MYLIVGDSHILSNMWINYIPYSRLFSRGKIFANARCGDISRVKISRMVNKELINNHTPIYFQGENICE